MFSTCWQGDDTYYQVIELVFQDNMYVGCGGACVCTHHTFLASIIYHTSGL